MSLPKGVIMRKVLLLVGAGIGYILGARAGRERYEQIAGQASKVWGSPKVQDTVEGVKASAPQVAHKVVDTAKVAADKAVATVTGHETTARDGSYENETGHIDADGTVEVDESGFGPGGDRLP